METYKCEKCRGRGSVSTKSRTKRGLCACVYCNGTGKVNWLENVFGKDTSIQTVEIKFVNPPSFAGKFDILYSNSFLYEFKTILNKNLFVGNITS